MIYLMARKRKSSYKRKPHSQPIHTPSLSALPTHRSWKWLKINNWLRWNCPRPLYHHFTNLQKKPAVSNLKKYCICFWSRVCFLRRVVRRLKTIPSKTYLYSWKQASFWHLKYLKSKMVHNYSINCNKQKIRILWFTTE